MTDEQNSEVVEALADTPSPEAPSDDAEMGAVWDRINVQNGADRAEDGKFKSTKPEEPEKAPEGDEPAEEPEAEPEEAPETAAPAHLPESIKSAWRDMTPAAREAVAKHQAEVDRKFSEQGRVLQAVKPIHDRLSQAVQQHPQFMNMTPAELAEGAVRLAAVQTELDQNPVETILKVAQQYGALDALQARLSGQQPSEQHNYTIQLQQKIAQLEKQVAQGTDPSAIDSRISAAMAQQEAARTVADFSKGKEHFGAVESKLPSFIAIAREQRPDASPAELLDAAYDMAIHADPDVRAKIAATAKAAATPDPQRTDAVRKATNINVKSKSAGKERELSEDERLASTYDRLMGA